MVGEREKNVLLKNLSHLGKKGAFYRSPQKLAVAACSDRRLRCKCTGDSVLGRRFRPGSGLIGTSGQTGDSGLEGSETPVRPETPVTFRCPSRLESSAAPQLGKEQRKT